MQPRTEQGLPVELTGLVCDVALTVPSTLTFQCPHGGMHNFNEAAALVEINVSQRRQTTKTVFPKRLSARALSLHTGAWA